jgi:hypothetical protein
VFLPGFATGTYNITFDLSGTEGVTYKLTGTQMLDYVHQDLTIKKFPPVTPLVNLAGPTGPDTHNNWRSGQVLTSSASYGTGTYRVKSLVSNLNGFNLNNADFIKLFDGDTATDVTGVTPYESSGGIMEVEIPTAIQLTKIVFNSRQNTSSTYNLSDPNCVSVNVLPDDTTLTGSFSYDATTYEKTLTVTDTRYVSKLKITISGQGHRGICELQLFGYVNVLSYTTVPFVGNDITIENALPQGDTDNVAFTLATGYEMTGLTLSEFTGSSTSSVNYTVQNITTS